jgi:CheY-like chemotaxis protein
MSSNRFYFDKVLIIDDSEVDRFIAKYFIQAYNFSNQVVEFGLAPHAIEYLENPPENLHEQNVLILLDIQMPLMTGFEFLERMRDFLQETRENFSVMILTSSFDIYDQRKAEENPFVKRYIVKPLNESRLEEMKQFYIALQEEKNLLNSKS